MRDPKSPATVSDVFANRYFIEAIVQALIEKKLLTKEAINIRLKRGRSSQTPAIQTEIDDMIARIEALLIRRV